MSEQGWGDALRDADGDDENLGTAEPVSSAAAPVGAPTDPRLVYGSVDEFLREFLRFAYARPVGPGTARNRWAARWWDSAEAVMRLEAIWRSWEQLRRDAGTGMSVWLLQHADPHMAVLMSPEGPFADSEDRTRLGQPLPYDRPPSALFPDERDR